eukprot:Skav207886  [mRNA]  locus=scaffold664:599109:624765:- [translate_table: standard]
MAAGGPAEVLQAEKVRLGRERSEDRAVKIGDKYLLTPTPETLLSPLLVLATPHPRGQHLNVLKEMCGEDGPSRGVALLMREEYVAPFAPPNEVMKIQVPDPWENHPHGPADGDPFDMRALDPAIQGGILMHQLRGVFTPEGPASMAGKIWMLLPVDDICRAGSRRFHRTPSEPSMSLRLIPRDKHLDEKEIFGPTTGAAMAAKARRGRAREMLKGMLKLDADWAWLAAANYDSRHLDENHPYDGSGMATRTCTDLPCLVIFIGYMIGMGCISSYAFENGNPRRLTHGFNFKGELCGVDEKVKASPFVFWCRAGAAQDGEPESLDADGAICVDTCPGNYADQMTCPGSQTYKVQDQGISTITTITQKMVRGQGQI